MSNDVTEGDAPAADAVVVPDLPKPRKLTYADLWNVVSMYETSAHENARLFPDPRGTMQQRQRALVAVLGLITAFEKHDKAFRKIMKDAEEATLKKSRGRRDNNQERANA